MSYTLLHTNELFIDGVLGKQLNFLWLFKLWKINKCYLWKSGAGLQPPLVRINVNIYQHFRIWIEALRVLLANKEKRKQKQCTNELNRRHGRHRQHGLSVEASLDHTLQPLIFNLFFASFWFSLFFYCMPAWISFLPTRLILWIFRESYHNFVHDKIINHCFAVALLACQPSDYLISYAIACHACMDDQIIFTELKCGWLEYAGWLTDWPTDWIAELAANK